MDPITHAFLGANAAQVAVKERRDTRWAAFIGALVGPLPDLDFLLALKMDPLARLEYHRQFTHSFLFTPFGALIVSLLLFGLFRKRFSFKTVFLFSLSAYFSHAFIDGCNTYGTMLFWPLSDARIHFDIIPVVDPIFTGILILSLCFAFLMKSPKPSYVGLALCACYLGFGYMQKQKATDITYEMARNNGEKIEKLLVAPVIGATTVWRVVYEDGENVHTHALNLTPFKEPVLYHGEQQKAVNIAALSQQYPRIADKIQRYVHFTDGFINMAAENEIGDLRYSYAASHMLPFRRMVLEQDHIAIRYEPYGEHWLVLLWHMFKGGDEAFITSIQEEEKWNQKTD